MLALRQSSDVGPMLGNVSFDQLTLLASFQIKNYIKYNVVEMKVIKRNFVVLRLA